MVAHLLMSCHVARLTLVVTMNSRTATLHKLYGSVPRSRGIGRCSLGILYVLVAGYEGQRLMQSYSLVGL